MGISIWQLLIILAIVLVLFGAKRLRNIGTDLGHAVKGFKSAMQDEEQKDDDRGDPNDRIEGSDRNAGDHTFDDEAAQNKESKTH